MWSLNNELLKEEILEQKHSKYVFLHLNPPLCNFLIKKSKRLGFQNYFLLFLTLSYITLGVMHKPRSHFFEIFDPPSPLRSHFY